MKGGIYVIIRVSKEYFLFFLCLDFMDRETELCASITSSQLGTQIQCPNLRFTFPEYRIEPTEEIAILLLKMLLFMEGTK